jgi:small subunit ribosomal protein S13
LQIFGAHISKERPLRVGLTAIFGIGRTKAEEICGKLEIDPGMRGAGLTSRQGAQIHRLLETDYLVQSDLKKFESANVKRLVEIGSYRGFRHTVGLPMRGQRSSTNARTQKKMGRSRLKN